MALRDLFRLRSRKPSEPSFRIEDFETPFTFRCFESVESLLERLKHEVARTTAEKVLVVGGYRALEALSQADFDGYQLLVNRGRQLGWLLWVLEDLRTFRDRAIVVSPFPRHWNPPAVKLVRASFDETLWAPADGNVGGTVYDIDASLYTPFLDEPSRASLRIAAESSREGVKILFVGLFAASYYREVLASQGFPPGLARPCVALVALDADGKLDSSEIEELRATLHIDHRQELLREVSNQLERECTASERGRERPEYTGGVLIPDFPTFKGLRPAEGIGGALEDVLDRLEEDPHFAARTAETDGRNLSGWRDSIPEHERRIAARLARFAVAFRRGQASIEAEAGA